MTGRSTEWRQPPPDRRRAAQPEPESDPRQNPDPEIRGTEPAKHKNISVSLPAAARSKRAPNKRTLEPPLTRLFDEVRAAGYPGCYSRVNDYVRATRPREPVESLVRFETPAGRQGQVDFGTFTLPWGRRHALVVVLDYSRLLWLHFFPRQTMPVLMEGLESVFDRFGGVPEELLFDQMRAVVLSTTAGPAAAWC